MRWTPGMLSAQARADESMLADGEGVWSWSPDAGVKLEGDRLRATEAKKPGLRGERAISCKPSRRECRLFRPNLW